MQEWSAVTNFQFSVLSDLNIGESNFQQGNGHLILQKGSKVQPVGLEKSKQFSLAFVYVNTFGLIFDLKRFFLKRNYPIGFLGPICNYNIGKQRSEISNAQKILPVGCRLGSTRGDHKKPEKTVYAFLLVLTSSTIVVGMALGLL